MAVTTADNVADYILCYTQDAGDFISNKKMQKLVYYAQAWFLALHDEPLFSEEIQAWVHGPVQPALYLRFKPYGWKPIEDDPECPTFSDERIQPHLDEIMRVFGDCTANHLGRLTHQEDPWRLTRGNLAPDEESTAVISQDLMRAFYKQMASNV